MLGPVLRRRFGHEACAEHVVFHRFAQVALHKWYVLVGSSMKDNLRPVCPQHSMSPLVVGNVANDAMDLHSSVVAGQFIVDRVEGILIAIQQDKYGGLQCDNLSAEF